MIFQKIQIDIAKLKYFCRQFRPRLKISGVTQEFPGITVARCGPLAIGTNTSHLCCIVGFTVLAQLTATFDPDRPRLFGTHSTRKDTAHFVTRIFRLGSKTRHRVPFLEFSAAMNFTAASLISNKPCISPRVLSSSSVVARADETPATRKTAATKEAYMRLFKRNGANIFTILAKSVRYQIEIWKLPYFQCVHCHTSCRQLVRLLAGLPHAC